MGGRETSAPFEEASAGGFSRCPAAGHPPGIESSCRARRSGPVWGFIKRPHCAYEDKDSESAEILRKVLEENIGFRFSGIREFSAGMGLDNFWGGSGHAVDGGWWLPTLREKAREGWGAGWDGGREEAGPKGRAYSPFFRGLPPCPLRKLRFTTVVPVSRRYSPAPRPSTRRRRARPSGRARGSRRSRGRAAKPGPRRSRWQTAFACRSRCRWRAPRAAVPGRPPARSS